MKRALFLLFLCLPQLLFSIEVLLLFGPPGSGKGTFAQYAKAKGYGHISAGDLLRDEINRETKIGLEIKEIIKRGDYIDPELMFQLVQMRAFEHTANNQPFIIDGYGKNTDDTNRLRNLLQDIQAEPRLIFLEASDNVCKERIQSRLVCPSCNAIYNEKLEIKPDAFCPQCKEACLQVRINDTPEVIEKRLKLYREQIHPCYQSLCAEIPYVYVNTECDIAACEKQYEMLLKNSTDTHRASLHFSLDQ